jgi:glycosyltransferase involved in cell wall biosynthesis
MRVLILSKALVVGQYQTKLTELTKFSDLELFAVVPPSWRDERGTIPLERAHTRGYELIVAPIALDGQFHLHFYPTLGKILARVRPQIVHIDEEPYNLATWLALRAARRVNARTIFFTWQNLLRRYPFPFAWMEADVLRRADFAIAGNQEAVQVLRAKNYRGRARVIPQFGTDAPVVAAPPPRDPNLFRIGYAGRLVPEKGIDLLLRAAAGLTGNWELRIVGGGPDLARLQSLARAFGIAARVRFDPPRASIEMPAWYAQVDVVVQPSLTRANWKEQFNRVLIEAMARAIPVIASDSGEMPNVVGDAGLIFAEGDVDALRAQIAALQNDPARAAELAQRGRARVLAHFTQTRIAAETYVVYREIISDL